MTSNTKILRLRQASEPAVLDESAAPHNFDKEHQSEPARGIEKELLTVVKQKSYFPILTKH